MKKIILNLSVFLILILGLAACSDDNPVDPAATYDFSSIINSYSDQVIIATYSNLNINTAAFQTACATFASNPTQDNLNAAANAWYAARVPWELSEAFLFGPVAFLSIDPSMDSWPVDET